MVRAVTAARIVLRAALFGALFVVVGGSAWAQAPPEVIASIEEQAPITRTDFDRWMAIAVARDETLTAVPDRPGYRTCAQQLRGTKQGRGKTVAQRRATCVRLWRDLRDQVLGFLLAASWVKGEAAELGIVVTAREVDRAFAEQKRQAFPKEADYREFLRESGSTEFDIRFQMEVELLQGRLVQRVTRDVRVTAEEIAAYYRSHREEFDVPAGRDTMNVLADTRARALQARRALAQGRSWASVAAKYGSRGYSDTRLLVTRDDGDADEEDPTFARAVFRAPLRVITGPVRGRMGWYVFEVRRVTRPSRLSLRQATPTIRSLLTSSRQQEALERFVTAYRTKWRSRTRCLAGFVVEDCGGELPSPAPPA